MRSPQHPWQLPRLSTLQSVHLRGDRGISACPLLELGPWFPSRKWTPTRSTEGRADQTHKCRCHSGELSPRRPGPSPVCHCPRKPCQAPSSFHNTGPDFQSLGLGAWLQKPVQHCGLLEKIPEPHLEPLWVHSLHALLGPQGCTERVLWDSGPFRRQPRITPLPCTLDHTGNPSVLAKAHSHSQWRAQQAGRGRERGPCPGRKCGSLLSWQRHSVPPPWVAQLRHQPS